MLSSDVTKTSRGGLPMRAVKGAFAALALAAFAGVAAAQTPAPAPAAKPAAAPAAKPAAAPAAKPAAAAKQPAAAAAAPAAGDQRTWFKICREAPKPIEMKDENKDGKPDAPAAGTPIEKVKLCTTFAELREGNSGVAVAAFAVKQIEGTDKRAIEVALAQFPNLKQVEFIRTNAKNVEEMAKQMQALPATYLLLAAGAIIKVDEAEPVALKFTRCELTTCYAEVEATDDLLTKLKSGKKVGIGFMDMAQQRRGYPLPLDGFATAHDGAPIDPKEYAKIVEGMFAKLAEIKKDQAGAAAAAAPAAAGTTAVKKTP